MINYVNKNKKDFDTDIEAVQALSEFNKTYGVQLNLKTTGTQPTKNQKRSLKHRRGFGQLNLR
jgi:hypothetical protein